MFWYCFNDWSIGNKISFNWDSLFPSDLECSLAWHCLTLSNLSHIPQAKSHKMHGPNEQLFNGRKKIIRSSTLTYFNLSWRSCNVTRKSFKPASLNALTYLEVLDKNASKWQLPLLVANQVLHMEGWGKPSCNVVHLLQLLLPKVG